MKKNPEYRIHSDSLTRGREDREGSIHDALLNLMRHSFGTVAGLEIRHEGHRQYFEASVLQVKARKTGARKGHRDLAMILSDPSSMYRVYSMRAMWQEGAEFFADVEEADMRMFMTGDGESIHPLFRSHSIDDAMVKAVALASEEGVCFLNCTRIGAGKEPVDIVYEVWVSSFPDMDKGSTSQTTFSYGVIPPPTTFVTHFNREIGQGKTYSIERMRGDLAGFNGKWSAPELWELMRRAMVTADEGDDVDLDEISSLVGDILGTLGFEWI